METGNWKLETRKWRVVYRRPRTEIRSLGFLARVVSNSQFLVSTFQFPRRVRRLTLALFTTSALLADTAALQAQGCAMCYNTAAAAKAAAIQALRSGILILLVPVALMFIGIFMLAFRSKERFSEFETRNWKLETGNSPGHRESAFACEFKASNFELRNPGGRVQQL